MRAFLIRRRQFLTFLAVGASGVLVNMAVFEVALRLLRVNSEAAHPLRVNAAAVAGWIASVASNFLLNERLTFAHRAAGFTSSRTRRLMRYYASAVTGLLLQLTVLNGVVWLVAHVELGGTLGAFVQAQRLRVGNLIGIGAGTIANYLLSRNWVFR